MARLERRKPVFVGPDWPVDYIVVHRRHPDPYYLLYFGLVPVDVAEDIETRYLEQFRNSTGVGLPHAGRFGHGLSVFLGKKNPDNVYTPQGAVVHVFTKRPFKGLTLLGRLDMSWGSWSRSYLYVSMERNRRQRIRTTIRLNGKKVVDRELIEELSRLIRRRPELQRLELVVENSERLRTIYERALLYRPRNPVGIKRLAEEPWEFLDNVRKFIMSRFPVKKK